MQYELSLKIYTDANYMVVLASMRINFNNPWAVQYLQHFQKNNIDHLEYVKKEIVNEELFEKMKVDFSMWSKYFYYDTILNIFTTLAKIAPLSIGVVENYSIHFNRDVIEDIFTDCEIQAIIVNKKWERFLVEHIVITRDDRRKAARAVCYSFLF